MNANAVEDTGIMAPTVRVPDSAPVILCEYSDLNQEHLDSSIGFLGEIHLKHVQARGL